MKINHQFNSINDFHKFSNLPKSEHPLISLIDYSHVQYSPEHCEIKWVQNFYSIGLKRNVSKKFNYGQQVYDFEEGVLSLVAPQQVIHIEIDHHAKVDPSGWLLLIHPDFLWNTSLAKTMKKYEFFGYAVNEALFLSQKEENMMLDIFKNIQREYQCNMDKFTQSIIVAQIELLLNYTDRFYERQFITRQITNHEVLNQLEVILNNYFNSEELIDKRVPNVKEVADQLNLTPNYLSSLLKVITGQSTQQHIHNRLIERAKERLSTTNLSVSEIAYELGFGYPASFLAFLSLLACKKLDQTPESTATKPAVFGTENGLKLYTNSFYGMDFLPKNSTSQDAMSDYLAVKSVEDFIREGGFSASNSSTEWKWKTLRNINYFIENCNDPAVPQAVRNNYLGIARYFRAYFYLDKVKRFGDVPWIGKALTIDDPALTAGRDKRELVMDSVLADINFACANISTTNDPSRTTITKWVAYAFKSRLCLFEGTFRKYHPELNLASTANKWLQEAASSADEIIKNGGFSLNTAGGPGVSYRQIFTSNTPLANEVLQSAVADLNLGVLNEANWWWTSGTYGAKASFTRTFINTYLKLDGTPYTNDPAYTTMLFKDEVKNRDLRLKQTIRSGDYKRTTNGQPIPAPPVFSYTFTGYQPIKWTLDDTYYDAGALNTNAIALFRYAEVLLNYAEAKAELGTLTDADWALTIGALRARAGITGGLTTKPTVADPYLIANYFPGIADPTLLEIRRERGIELSLEGLRFADLLRWKRGILMEQEWNGFYVPALNTPLDLNEDGILDVAFYQGTRPTPGVAGVTYVDVSPRTSSAVNSQLLKNGSSGELIWMKEIPRKWNERNYYYPIPLVDLQRNPNLKQNAGWE